MSLENFDNFVFKNGPIENFVYVELMNLFSGCQVTVDFSGTKDGMFIMGEFDQIYS